MSQVTTSPRQPFVDYGTPSTPKASSWLNVRVILFVLVFGGLIGLPGYLYVNAVMTGGITTRADGVKEIDLKFMSSFTFDQQVGKTSDIPPQFRELDGKKVALVGEMYAPNAAGSAIDKFDLVYSIAKCCFSGPAQVQHFIRATPAKPGTPLPYYSGLVRTTGTLHVGVTTEDGKITSVYRLDVDSIDPI